MQCTTDEIGHDYNNTIILSFSDHCCGQAVDAVVACKMPLLLHMSHGYCYRVEAVYASKLCRYA